MLIFGDFQFVDNKKCENCRVDLKNSRNFPHETTIKIRGKTLADFPNSNK
jgi:hypothetical protein